MALPALSRRASVRLPWARFQLPPRQTQHADFRHWAFLLPSSQGLCGRSNRERFRQIDDPAFSPSRSYSFCLLHLFQPNPFWSAFALRYILRRRPRKPMDGFVIPSLPPLLSENCSTAGRLCSAGVTPPQRCRVESGRASPPFHRPLNQTARAVFPQAAFLSCSSHGVTGPQDRESDASVRPDRTPE